MPVFFVKIDQDDFFNLKLREPRSTAIAVESDDELATVGQIRYMRQLGIAAVAGISKFSLVP